MYATCHDPKIYSHIPTSNYIQICSGLDLAGTETVKPEVKVMYSDLETVGDSSGPNMYLHTKY